MRFFKKIFLPLLFALSIINISNSQHVFGNNILIGAETSDDRFIVELDVVNGSIMTIPTIDASGTYNYTVDWGDGSPISTCTTFDDLDRIHTYTAAATVELIIDGTMTSFLVNNNAAIRGLFKKILNWGDTSIEELNFDTCFNMTAVTATDVLNSSNMTSFSELFNVCTSLTTINNIETWDTSTITNMNQVFARNNVLSGMDLTNWDTSNVTTFNLMFDRCFLFNGDISSFDVSAATGANFGMFAQCTAFNQDVSGWDVSAWTTMQQLFYLCSAFNQDVSGWNVGNVTNFSYTFRQATAFNQDLSSWQIQNATTMDLMVILTSWSTANYDLALNAWSLLSVQSGVLFGCQNTTYTIATSQAARDILTGGPNNWVITDGGGI